MVVQRGDGLPVVVDVDASRAGDDLSLAELYSRWSPLVYSLALRSLRSVADAEEVTRQVFTEVWGARDSLGPDRSRLPARLVEITREKIADTQAYRRAAGRLRRPVVEDAPVEDSRAAADLAERLVCADGMSHLDTEPQEVLRLALDQRLTHTEIAERLQLPEATVRNHLHRALLELRQRWEVSTDAR